LTSRAIASSAARDRAPPTSLLPYDGIVWLCADALGEADASRLFEELMALTTWRQEIARVMGRHLPIPRLTAWHGAAGYVYSGIEMTPAPWNAALLELKAVAEACADHAFNSVLLNLYRDGRDSVSWHADNEPGLGRDPVIASVSLGAARRFQMKHRRREARIALDLPPGSCLVMAGATQHHWLHQVPKTSRPVGPRINLTFRAMATAA
jgi:alkylated DNA repair dioxygenase AlkB